ncbi:hypothetical protein A6E15_04415 [Natrinema saccharevitans]|uniref:Uncharacterized protein n=1 Tax=Natrinema saccharevitans TaxID=301967 RepID=A0A1S8ATU5_9EURY|nr:hypothetical protein [Natrinema saccharevitans]OLZ40273.1 hypothetical protein A6E15_04415 [Natrinema saccharevitans]
MSLRNPSAAFFSVVLGGYVGVLALCATSRVLAAEYTAIGPVAIGACAGLIAAGWCHRRPALATTLARTRLYVLPVAVIVAGAAVVPVLPAAGVRGLEPWLREWFVEIVVFSFGGAAVYLVTVNRHVTALRDRESVLAEWHARPDRRYRRLLRAGGLVLGCSLLVVGFALVFVLEPSVNPLPAFGGALIGQAITAGRPRTYTLFESGLCVHRSGTINYQFVPRSQLRTVDLAADRLEIGRGLPWPLPIRCATTTMARPERVADALERVLESAPAAD